MKTNNWTNISPIKELKLLTINKEIADNYMNRHSGDYDIIKSVDHGMIKYKTVYKNYTMEEEKITGDKILYKVFVTQAAA